MHAENCSIIRLQKSFSPDAPAPEVCENRKTKAWLKGNSRPESIVTAHEITGRQRDAYVSKRHPRNNSRISVVFHRQFRKQFMARPCNSGAANSTTYGILSHMHSYVTPSAFTLTCNWLSRFAQYPPHLSLSIKPCSCLCTAHACCLRVGISQQLIELNPNCLHKLACMRPTAQIELSA